MYAYRTLSAALENGYSYSKSKGVHVLKKSHSAFIHDVDFACFTMQFLQHVRKLLLNHMMNICVNG